KAREVKPASMMIKHYTDALAPEDRVRIIRPVQKMVLAVGAQEVHELEKRYAALKELFPLLEKLDGAGIAHYEPEVMRGRDPNEPVLALYNPEGYAVNYGLLAASFAKEAKKNGGDRVEIRTGTTVTRIERDGTGYRVDTEDSSLTARMVVVDADAYSLGFAKKMGLGKEFSLIPIAGNFYFTPTLLRGKVYTVQEPRMPFAAVHGDPDLTRDHATRWGPTARFFPVLEARKFSTSGAFFRAAGLLRPATWVSFMAILLEPIRVWYLLQNFVYDLPVIGRYALAPQLRKIVPGIRAHHLQRAEGYGGMRLQRVDTTKRELLLGEGKIVDKNIIFNMTPSPGASVSLHNALRDADQIVAFDPHIVFDKKRLLAELCDEKTPVSEDDVSLKESYAS
ncbi:MAG TPA: FAD-dependent oxidoreductase, partial [Candidatus Paceibacterota bacterium]|nr:FAD-dependent oxidoreductase [Candidatus Paceibacterota bacterium]